MRVGEARGEGRHAMKKFLRLPVHSDPRHLETNCSGIGPRSRWRLLGLVLTKDVKDKVLGDLRKIET